MAQLVRGAHVDARGTFFPTTAGPGAPHSGGRRTGRLRYNIVIRGGRRGTRPIIGEDNNFALNIHTYKEKERERERDH